MTIIELQAAIGTKPDGQWGPMSRAALLAAFVNKSAPAITGTEISAYAARLGVSEAQLRAVAAVESSGGGFDSDGRPKILFERHIFARLTDGKWSNAPYSNSAAGGYGEDSWTKLETAAGKDPDAAFSACSWGKFQVLGVHCTKLAYPSPFALAHSTVMGEREHYELLARYIETFGLKRAMQALSADPNDCRAFASGYNGPGYRRGSYHIKLAREMS
jgi:hypothetical protein